MAETRPRSVEDLAGLVVEHAHHRVNGWRFILGIAGPPAAGKSTLAAALRDQINAQSRRSVAEIAPLDGFHLSNQALAAAGKLWRKGAPDTFAIADFATLLKDAREGRATMAWPTYDRAAHQPVPDGVRFSPETEILITEGNYLFLDIDGWIAVGKALDEKWYLDVDMETVQQRLINRHVKGGKTSAAAQEKVSTSDLPNALLVAKSRAYADLRLRESEGNYYLTGNSAL